MEDSVFRTDSLTLATVLSLAGHKYRLVRITDSKVIWEFTEPEATDESEKFDDLIDDFEQWRLRIEPRQYTLRAAEMRKEIFAVIPRHVRPGTPSTATT